MLNMLNMDIYRMFKTKSLYVIWIILIFCIVMTTWIMKIEYSYQLDMEQNEEYQSGIDDTYSEDGMSVGIQVNIPTELGENVTVFDMMFANLQSKFFAVFLVIFAVIFSTADFGSGYIKNFGGQVKRREGLIISKGISLFIYTVLTLIISLLAQAVSNLIFFGYLKWGIADKLIQYMGIQILLHFALTMIIMTISILARNNVFSMIFAICLCMNLMMLLYSGIQIIIKKVGMGTVNISKYTISGKIYRLPMDLTSGIIGQAVLLSVIYIGISAVISMIIYRKRDIC